MLSLPKAAEPLIAAFSVVRLIFTRQVCGPRLRLLGTPWYAKKEATLSDAICAVHCLCWESVLKQSRNHGGVIKLPSRLRLTLPDHLSRAA